MRISLEDQRKRLLCLFTNAKEDSTGPEVRDVRVMVVAIRGTASIHDWPVNFNNTSQLEDSLTAMDLGDRDDDRVQSDLLVSSRVPVFLLS